MEDDSHGSLEGSDEVTFENMDQVLTMDTKDELTQVQYDLPAHERCAAHTLT